MPKGITVFLKIKNTAYGKGAGIDQGTRNRSPDRVNIIYCSRDILDHQCRSTQCSGEIHFPEIRILYGHIAVCHCPGCEIYVGCKGQAGHIPATAATLKAYDVGKLVDKAM